MSELITSLKRTNAADALRLVTLSTTDLNFVDPVCSLGETQSTDANDLCFDSLENLLCVLIYHETSAQDFQNKG